VLRLALLALLGLLKTGACRADEAYIWQRLWDAPLVEQLTQQKDLYQQLRVLALQQQSERQWVDVQVDAKALIATQLPITMVVRLPGAKPLLNAAQLGERIVRKLELWQLAGIPVARIEVDFDCAESQLANYQQLLLGLRLLLPAAIKLDITALPAWLRSEQMPKLIAASDRITLQVHSVLAPKRGLFDPRMAEYWIRQLNQISTKAFSVALPAYGAKLVLNERDQVIGVEHEMELSGSVSRSVELKATPQSVRTLLDALQSRPVANLQTIVWFRLPLPGDQRAWHPKTLRAVILKQPLVSKIETRYVANNAGGYDVIFKNVGNLNATTPLRLSVNQRCTGEGLQTYRFEKSIFSARLGLELAPDQQRIIAWLRCPAGIAPNVLSR
jgi:Protein of unknown function (DUF3142)